MANLTAVSIRQDGAEIGRGVLAAGRNVILYTALDGLPPDETPVEAVVRETGDQVAGQLQRVDPEFAGVYLDVEVGGPYEPIPAQVPPDKERSILHQLVDRWAREADDAAEPSDRRAEVEPDDDGPVAWWCKYVCHCC